MRVYFKDSEVLLRDGAGGRGEKYNSVMKERKYKVLRKTSTP